MKAIKFLGSTMFLMALTLTVQAQVRSNNNSTRDKSTSTVKAQKENKESDAQVLRQTTRTTSNVKSDEAISVRSGSVRNSPAVRSTDVSQQNNSARSSSAMVGRNSSNSTKIRNNQNATNAKSVRATSTSNERVRTVRVENQPEAINYKRNAVRYENGNSERAIYYTGNQKNFNKVKFHKHTYYLDNGYYYRWHDNRYKRVMAPVGFMLYQLPVGYINIYVGGNQYYYYQGTYYNYYQNNYYVVQPPVGAIVYALPMDYERVFVNGQTYYEYFGVLYSKVYYYGDVAYQVIGYLN